MDGAHLALASGNIGVGEGQHDVVEHTHAWEQIEALENEADTQGANFGELVIGEFRHVQALEQIRARRGGVQASEDVHERGFAGA